MHAATRVIERKMLNTVARSQASLSVSCQGMHQHHAALVLLYDCGGRSRVLAEITLRDQN